MRCNVSRLHDREPAFYPEDGNSKFLRNSLEPSTKIPQTAANYTCKFLIY
jgi:hypothetical protein